MYGPDKAGEVHEKLLTLVHRYRASNPPPNFAPAISSKLNISEKDAILITYGDMISNDRQPPLEVLGIFLNQYAAKIVSTIHILPFYPYSSDDGFSVINFREVNEELGSWHDLEHISHSFRLMFDAVINHVSVEHDWFQSFLSDALPYSDFFITVDEGTDLSHVFRPRALPLTSQFRTVSGVKRVWTTFSTDQVDLNYANPEVLLAVFDLLLFYTSKRAEFIRLDAIAYLWKEPGTSSINLPQTHSIIQTLRLALDLAAPQTALITETNVSHEDNVTYFGDGFNEAHLVYSFTLPPLVLHAFHVGDARKLSSWSRQLETPSKRTHFFNFTASHDGIGLVPAKGFLEDDEIAEMANRIENLGGFVSYRSNSDGTQSPYELNMNFLDALAHPDETSTDYELIGRRFLTSQAIMLALKGVPGIYFHSLFGSRSWFQGVKDTGLARKINRQKLDMNTLVAALSNKSSLSSIVYEGFKKLLAARRSSKAFHPSGDQTIPDIHPSLFSLLRQSPDGNQIFLGLHSVANNTINCSIDIKDLAGEEPNLIIDLVDGNVFTLYTDGAVNATIPPYGLIWLGWRRSRI